MRYLCVIYLDPDRLAGLAGDDYEALVTEGLAYLEELAGSGHLVAAERLQPAETATSLRVRNAKVAISDGPFVETKEKLGGFVLIEARDLNEAIQVASKLPPARLGGIEVRPVRSLKESQ